MTIGGRLLAVTLALFASTGAVAGARSPVASSSPIVQQIGPAAEGDVFAFPPGASERARRLAPPPRRVVIISDSAMAGIRWNGALGGFEGFVADHRLESCRRLVTTSCNGREGRRPPTVLKELELVGSVDPSDVLVVATGYNDWHAGFGWQSRTILDAARERGFTTVAWVTYRELVGYTLPGTGGQSSNYRYMNDELDAIVASGDYPELQLWDLDAYTRGAPHWFASDGVHERWIGSWGVADWVSRHVAALDGRPCARPWSLAIGQEQACPNPDPLPPVRGYPDLSTIYGL